MPIYMRLTVEGKPFEMTVQRECEPDKWNKNTGRVKGSSEVTKQVNSYLEIFQAKVYEAQRSLLNLGVEVTAASLKSKLLGAPEKVKPLLVVYRYHVNQVVSLVEKNTQLAP